MSPDLPPRKSAELTDLQFSGSGGTQLWAIGYGNDSVHVGRREAKRKGNLEGSSTRGGSLHAQAAGDRVGGRRILGICGDNDNAPERSARPAELLHGSGALLVGSRCLRQATAGGLGSHYDMLHNTSKCRDRSRRGQCLLDLQRRVGSLDRYDFKKPHAPGADDHSDGEILRYARGVVRASRRLESPLLRRDRPVSLRRRHGRGNKRIIRLDTSSRMAGAPASAPERAAREECALGRTRSSRRIVASGILEQPSGLGDPRRPALRHGRNDGLLSCLRSGAARPAARHGAWTGSLSASRSGPTARSGSPIGSGARSCPIPFSEPAPLRHSSLAVGPSRSFSSRSGVASGLFFAVIPDKQLKGSPVAAAHAPISPTDELVPRRRSSRSLAAWTGSSSWVRRKDRSTAQRSAIDGIDTTPAREKRPVSETEAQRVASPRSAWRPTCARRLSPRQQTSGLAGGA